MLKDPPLAVLGSLWFYMTASNGYPSMHSGKLKLAKGLLLYVRSAQSIACLGWSEELDQSINLGFDIGTRVQHDDINNARHHI